MFRIRLLLCAFVTLCVPAFSQTTATSQTDKPQAATWEPKFELDDELFPSLVLELSGRTHEVPPTSRHFGDPLGMAEVVIRPVTANAKAHVEIQVEGFTSPSELDVTLPEAGKEYTVAPLLRYDYSRLALIDQSVPATVTYSVTLDGANLGDQTRPIRVCSVNDVPFLILSTEGKQKDFSFLFAGYVNESHPFVQSVLQDALRWKAVNSFIGYQGTPQDVRLQVFAVWNVFQRRHLHYSSITTPSATSPTGHVFSQSVRFIDQSIQSQQANCVDGSVLFASVLYKIGIEPILVLKPGHMFVGYYLDANHKTFEFLETTRLGVGHQPGTYNIAFSPILHPVQGSESWQQFVQALQIGTNTYNTEVAPALQQHKPQYGMIDIAKVRQAGVNAIPRSASLEHF